jgi:outer membrane immunogenic protein
MGNVKTDFNVAPVVATFTFGPVPIPGFSGSDRTYPSGFIGGGQIGYNWQYSPLIVVGLEADIQGALEKDSGTLTNAFNFPCCADITVVGTAVTQYEAKIDWFGTVRGRIGYLWGDGAVMTYVTGGPTAGSS